MVTSRSSLLQPDQATPTMPATIPEPDAETDREAVEQFLKTIERLREHDGPIHASPLFGEMDRETMLKLQLRHTAHHLAFLLPSQ